MMNMPDHFIQFSGVSKSFNGLSADVTNALTKIDLSIKIGEIVCVIGESGSGKSTLLKLLAGLDQPSEGRIIKNDNIRTGFVFQDNTIFPWFTVERNIAYPLEIKNAPKSERKSRAWELALLVGLDPDRVLQKYPKELSGGEKRRVAIAMAIAHDANLLLLDEPTSSLDDINKWKFQEVIQSLWLKSKFTCVLVTHDLEEAVLLGHRVITLNHGQLKSVVDVSFDYPRTRETRSLTAFQLIRNHLSETL
jgi:NitT/TauT family transport system ATP-binding protein